ncbi:MAG TPA: IS21 family transposase [Verrucomicrobiota bacterium]|nr:IS21 family transposase [Verrucomicrobiota bacterium]
MANHLKMAKVQTIQVLREQGWSYRRIARELGVGRNTVKKYVELNRAGTDPPGGLDGQTEPNPPTGSDGQTEPNLPTGSDGQTEPNPPAGFGHAEPAVSGPASRCEPYRERILAALEQGLSAQRIWQDLRDEGFADGYDSVKRYVRRLGQAGPEPFRRMECAPGEQAQVDFGTGAPVVIPADQPLPMGVKTRRRKTHVFRVVLSHSRKAYSEVVYRQTAEQFIRCLENAFWHFGGVPRTLVIDNLKAAVTKADWFDPELTPKIQSFCKHYGTVILPTKIRTPRHKGKTERGVGYVQDNALKGRTFASLADQNRYLLDWERTVADTRIHGTTQKQVKKCFEERERPALLPLPVNRFPSFAEGKRKVNRDGHIEVAKAYYSVPPEHLGQSVWVRWDSHTVRIFDHRFKQVEFHALKGPGEFSTHDRNIPPQKRSGIERGAAYHLTRAHLIGSHTGQWAEQMIQQRGIEGVRVLLGLLSLSQRHPADAIEQACETALTHGAYRLKTLRVLIKRRGDRQEQFEFIDEHPIIRSLSDYGDLVHAAFNKET